MPGSPVLYLPEFIRKKRAFTQRKARDTGIGISLVHEVNGDVLLLRGMPGEAVKCYRQAQALEPGREGLQARIDRAREVMNKNRPAAGKRRQSVRFPEEIARAGRLERDGEPGRRNTSTVIFCGATRIMWKLSGCWPLSQ